MTTIEMRNRIKQYVDHADERILKLFTAMVESEEQELSPSLKEELDNRLALHKKNPDSGKSWEELQNELQKKYAL